MNDTFANRLQQAMSIRNIKQVELCEKTGLSSSLINKYLKGKALARQDKIYILAKALNVSEGWLMGFDVSIERTPDKLRNNISNIRMASHNGVDTEGLDENDIAEINLFIEKFIKPRKEKNK